MTIVPPDASRSTAPAPAARRSAADGSTGDPTAPTRGPPTPLVISSEQLFGGASEVQIDHRGALYRLKKTSLGKLILTK